MKRRNFLKLLVFGGGILAASETKSTGKAWTNEMDDPEPDLVNEAEKYLNKTIRISGKILHICGVTGKKMKLQTSQGVIVKVLRRNSSTAFDKSYNGKDVIIQGVMSEKKITGEKIANMEKANRLLCHIDHTPCIDKAWVQKQIENGQAAELMKNDIGKLRERLENSGKNYVSQFTITANSIKIV